MTTPNPGSDEARKLGCKCPIIDNGHGRGVYTDEAGNPLFWINGNCPIHGQELEQPPDECVGDPRTVKNPEGWCDDDRD
jgi:hypothetical protein